MYGVSAEAFSFSLRVLHVNSVTRWRRKDVTSCMKTRSCQLYTPACRGVRFFSASIVALTRTARPGIHHQWLLIPAAGYRNNSSGALNNVGSNGNYWSASPNSSNGYNLNFNSNNVNPSNNNNRANGFSVRCVQVFTDLFFPVSFTIMKWMNDEE